MAKKPDYRYEWQLPDNGQKLLFIMLNPSKALNPREYPRNPDRWHDRTTRWVCGFACRRGYRQVKIVNLYAAMTKDYKELNKMANPVGRKRSENDKKLKENIAQADKIICAWGVEKKGPEGRDRVSEVWDMIKKLGKEEKTFALKINKTDGSPAHPQGLSYSVELKPYAPPWAAEI